MGIGLIVSDFKFTFMYDQLKRKMKHRLNPERIISIVPSLTELLFDLGLDDKVVGITKFCYEPHEWYKTKNRVGGTKNLNIEKIIELQPDLIIANKEENDKEQIEYLASKFNVFISDVYTLRDAFECVEKLGRLCGKQYEGLAISEKIKIAFSLHIIIKKYEVAYLIWNEPIMVAANNTFINSMMSYAGFDNVFNDKKRYPTVSIDEIKERNPEVILLSSEPFPFKNDHLQTYQKHFPDSKILLVEGDLFSWYGSRMRLFPDYIKELRKKISA